MQEESQTTPDQPQEDGNTSNDRPPSTFVIRPAQDPGTMELEWPGAPGAGQALRMLRAAETAILQRDRERMELTCTPDQKGVLEILARWPDNLVTRDGDRYTVQLVYTAEDGYIHEDDDDRTPLHRITCPTCVERIAKSRTRARDSAMGGKNTPKEIAGLSRRIAEAYNRLAEIEEVLKFD